MGNYLAERRSELGLTQKEVAEAVGVTEATVSRWESGTIANMRRDKINLLAKALHTTPNFVMTGESASAQPTKTLAENKRNVFSGMNEMVSNWKAQRVYGEAIQFKKPGTEKTVFALNLFYQFDVLQFDDDAVESMVTIAPSGSRKGFRVPEKILEDQDDITANIVEIIGYMPEDSGTGARAKLHTLLKTLNEDGIDKVLSYVEYLTNNTKYRQKVDIDKYV